MTVAAWLQNDGLFKEQLAIGHRWAEHVVSILTAAGLDAEATPMSVRATVEDRGQYAQELDIVVEGIRVECKSRKLRFTDSPSSYPYRTAFLDTVSGWDAKETKPTAVVLVSQLTGACLVIPVRTSRDSWTTRAIHDRVRNIDERCYECPRELLLPMATFVDWLAKRSPSR